MAETVAIDGQSVAHPRSRKPATVSVLALALHLDCSRTYIGKLEAEGVIQRHGDGFPLDQSRVAYLRYLRRERRPSPRSEAHADHVKAKTEMLQLRLMEKRRELVRQDEVNEFVDGLCGMVLTALSSMPARCAPRGDLAVRRSIERVVFEVRTEMAKVCQEMTDKNGEPFPNGSTYQTVIGDREGSTPIRLGLQTCPPGYKTALHYHPYMEAITILEGVGEAWLEGADGLIALAPGMTLVFPPNVRHQFRALGDQPFKILGVHASPHRIVIVDDSGRVGLPG